MFDSASHIHKTGSQVVMPQSVLLVVTVGMHASGREKTSNFQVIGLHSYCWHLKNLALTYKRNKRYKSQKQGISTKWCHMLSSNRDYIFKERGEGKHWLAGMGTALEPDILEIITHFRKKCLHFI